MEPVEISVLIPARNVEDLIGAQLESLCAQDYAGTWELVVADNGSTDGTVETVRSFLDRLPLRLVDASGRRGASHARNVALGASSAESIVFLDADDVSDPRLIGVYAKGLREHPFLGGRLDHGALRGAGSDPWLAATDEALPKAFGVVPFPIGANFAISRSLLDEIGAFDEELTSGGEEVDLAIRAHLHGVQVVWTPQAVVRYRHRPTLRGVARQQYLYGRGATQLFARHRQALSLRPSTVRRTTGAVARLVKAAPKLLRGQSRRREWIWQASALAGNLRESLRLRTWYVG